MPPSRSARAAPASTVSVPCDGFAYLSQSLKLEWRTACGAKRVPTRSPAHAPAIVPGVRPLAITVAMPAAVAISAATTFERIPPEPSGDSSWPISKSCSTAWSVTSSTSRAPGSRRGFAVYSPSVSVSSTSRSAAMSTATCAARKSLSPNEISSVVVVSFSLITGTTRQPSSVWSVRRALR